MKDFKVQKRLRTWEVELPWVPDEIWHIQGPVGINEATLYGSFFLKLGGYLFYSSEIATLMLMTKFQSINKVYTF